MKNLVKYMVVITVISVFTGCKSELKEKNSTETTTEVQAVENTNLNADISKTALLNNFIDSYLVLKNALVNDSEKEAAEAAKLMIIAIDNFDKRLLTDAEKTLFLEIEGTSKEHAEHIVKSDLNHQREHFQLLSEDLIELVDILGTTKTFYSVYCPMYKKKGAFWLSEIQEIKNPYFGSKMLTCGEVKSQIN